MSIHTKNWVICRPKLKSCVAAFIDGKYVNCVVSADQRDVQPLDVRLIKLENKEEITVPWMTCKHLKSGTMHFTKTRLILI